MNYTFTDEWGEHVHTVRGAPFGPSVPITCASCIHALDSSMTAWLAKLSERHSLPDNFWDGYTYPWS